MSYLSVTEKHTENYSESVVFTEVQGLCFLLSSTKILLSHRKFSAGLTMKKSKMTVIATHLFKQAKTAFSFKSITSELWYLH